MTANPSSFDLVWDWRGELSMFSGGWQYVRIEDEWVVVLRVAPWVVQLRATPC